MILVLDNRDSFVHNLARYVRELGWEAVRSIHEMCADAWRWQSQNPQGYEDT